MTTDQDVRELLERMAREPAIGPINPEPILRRAHRRLARTVVLGFACVVLAAVAIGAANLLPSGAPVPLGPNPTEEESNERLPQILREGELLDESFGTGDLEALDPRTEDRRTLVDCCGDGDGDIVDYAMSADGRWLAYEVLCGGGSCPGDGLWVTNALGDEHRLTGGGVWAWSPQGSTLAVSVGSGLLTIDPRTGDRTTVAPSFVDALAWSPDGTDIVYEAAGLESVNLDSGEITELADARNVGTIAWSPDGTRIVFDDSLGERNRIIIMNRDGSDQRVLVEQGAPQGPGAPAWSPDSTKIAYVTTPGNEASGFTLEIWVIGADGSNATRLIRGESGRLGDWNGPVWSPDGSRIAFYEALDLELGSWIAVNADGTGSPEPIDEIEVQTW